MMQADTQAQGTHMYKSTDARSGLGKCRYARGRPTRMRCSEPLQRYIFKYTDTGTCTPTYLPPHSPPRNAKA